MAKVTNAQFLKFLSNCNFDLHLFRDLTFDNLCDEKSLVHFLLWLCTNFDGDNVDVDNEYIGQQFDGELLPEDLGEDYEDLFEDIILSEERKLKSCEDLRTKLNLLEEKLRQKEKLSHDEIVQAENVLAAAVANSKNDELGEEMDSMYKSCLDANPYDPDDEIKSDILNTALCDLYKASVCEVEDSFIKETELMREPKNVEEIALAAQMQENLSIRQLESTRIWLKNIPLSINFKYLLSLSRWNIPECLLNSDVIKDIQKAAQKTVNEVGDRRKTIVIQRKQSIYSHLEEALKLNYKILMDSYIHTLFVQSFINVCLSRTDELVSLVYNHFSSINKKCQNIEDTINRCSVKDRLPETHATKPVSVYSADLILNCRKLLQALIEEHDKNLKVREVMSKILKNFRSGPTLQFCYLPMDCIVLYNNCRNLHEKIGKDLRHLAGLYCNVKSTMRGDAERSQKLMWVYFLTDPNKMASFQHEYSSFNMTFRSDK